MKRYKVNDLSEKDEVKNKKAKDESTEKNPIKISFLLNNNEPADKEKNDKKHEKLNITEKNINRKFNVKSVSVSNKADNSKESKITHNYNTLALPVFFPFYVQSIPSAQQHIQAQVEQLSNILSRSDVKDFTQEINAIVNDVYIDAILLTKNRANMIPLHYACYLLLVKLNQSEQCTLRLFYNCYLLLQKRTDAAKYYDNYYKHTVFHQMARAVTINASSDLLIDQYKIKLIELIKYLKDCGANIMHQDMQGKICTDYIDKDKNKNLYELLKTQGAMKQNIADVVRYVIS